MAICEERGEYQTENNSLCPSPSLKKGLFLGDNSTNFDDNYFVNTAKFADSEEPHQIPVIKMP